MRAQRSLVKCLRINEGTKVFLSKTTEWLECLGFTLKRYQGLWLSALDLMSAPRFLVEFLGGFWSSALDLMRVPRSLVECLRLNESAKVFLSKMTKWLECLGFTLKRYQGFWLSVLDLIRAPRSLVECFGLNMGAKVFLSL